MKLCQNIRRAEKFSPRSFRVVRQDCAAAAQAAKALGSIASSFARMACANTGAAPSVEMPITSGERLTIAPKAKSQNSGLSITLTGTAAWRAACTKSAASLSFSNVPTATAAPVKSAAIHGRACRATEPRGGSTARARISSDMSAAYTSTRAPAADSNSAFHAAAALPPASTVRRPSSARKMGSLASGAMRPDGISDGVRCTVKCEPFRSVHVRLIAAFTFHIRDEFFRPLRRAAAVLRNDVRQRRLDVLRHAQRVAAHVDVCAIVEPCPDVAADFAHAVMHVDFLFRVA